MSCCSNMPCHCCRHLVRSTAVALADGALAITIPAVTLSNRERVCLVVAQALPAGTTADTPVQLLITGSTTPYPLQTHFGNRVYADQIRTRRVYHLTAATDTGLFVTHDCIPRTGHVFPTLPAPAPAPTETARTGGK